MAAFSATDLRHRVPRLLIEWAPFVAVLFVYDRLRGFADGLLFHARELPQIHIENALFGTPAPTVWLQSRLWDGAGHLHWWDYATWFVYLTHFFATLVVASVLWTWVHDRFARYATMVCALALTGFATYVLYPAVPPWLAARHGNLRRVQSHDRHRLEARAARAFRLVVREGAALRQQRRGDAVAARRVRAPDRAVPLARRAALGSRAAGALPARDGVRARLLG